MNFIGSKVQVEVVEGWGPKYAKFSTQKASQRLRKNEIRGLENSRGEWVQDKNDIVTEMENYFNIFPTTLPDDVVINLVLEGGGKEAGHFQDERET